MGNTGRHTDRMTVLNIYEFLIIVSDLNINEDDVTSGE